MTTTPDSDRLTEHHVHRLVEGAFAIVTPDGRRLIVTPIGEFIEFALDETTWLTLRLVLTGARLPSELVEDPSVAHPDRLHRALASLVDEGLIDPEPHRQRAPLGTTAVFGDGPVADSLVDILTRAGAATSRHDTGPTDDGIDRVVACAGWLPDARWLALDRWCAERSLPWHRCWREGSTAWIGPLTTPDRSASYADLRLRRLAASSWPTELEVSWNHLESAEVRPPRWDDATVAVVAGALAADLLAGPDLDRTASMWRGYDLPTRTWHAHPVLPIPLGVRR